MHLKRYSMPKFWGMGVKKEKFVITPRGSHPKNFCIPLNVVLRNILKLSDTGKEARSILAQAKVLVDKKVRKDKKFGVGLMDIIEIPEMKIAYRVEVKKGGLFLNEVKDTTKKICKIINKTSLKGGKEQLNLHDGKNIIADKKGYKVGDSVELSLTDNKIVSHLELKKGNKAIVFAGKNIGTSGIIKELPERKFMLEKAVVSIDSDGKDIETLRDYVFVINNGKGKE